MKLEDRISWLNDYSETILKLDFSYLDSEKMIDMADYALRFILDNNLRDLLILYDMTQSKMNSQVLQRLKFITKNYGYVRKRSAVLGMSGARRVFFNGIMVYTENKMRAFNTLPEAISYLVQN